MEQYYQVKMVGKDRESSRILVPYDNPEMAISLMGYLLENLKADMGISVEVISATVNIHATLNILGQ